MLIKRPGDIKPSEITSKTDYCNRRRFMQESAIGVIALSTPALFSQPAQAGTKLDGVTKGVYQIDEELTPYDDITSYNNFYEFGTGKSDPKEHSGGFMPKPWSLEVTGECEMPGTYALEDFISPHQLEERIYRLRCVEAWSMVVPWVGGTARPGAQTIQTDRECQVRGVQNCVSPQGNARTRTFVSRLAIRRRVAN